jgi:hypothetical protein
LVGSGRQLSAHKVAAIFAGEFAAICEASGNSHCLATQYLEEYGAYRRGDDRPRYILDCTNQSTFLTGASDAKPTFALSALP